MCRSIKTLYNFDPPATPTEIRDAALQFVRKISGLREPSLVNQKVFNEAVESISRDVLILLESLKTDALPKNREHEAKKAKERSVKRFGGL